MNPKLKFVHRYIPGSSNRTLLLLHGTGGNEDDLLSLGRELDPAAALLSPRGQVLENGQPRFFRRLAEGVFDLEDLKERTNDLADFILAAANEYGFERNQLIAVGYSNGANIAASILLLRPRVLSNAALFRAMVPIEPEQASDLSHAHVWIGSGKHDSIIDRREPERLAEMLRNSGAHVSLQFFEAGHGLTKSDLMAARQWLETLAI